MSNASITVLFTTDEEGMETYVTTRLNALNHVFDLRVENDADMTRERLGQHVTDAMALGSELVVRVKVTKEIQDALDRPLAPHLPNDGNLFQDQDTEYLDE